MSSFSGVGSTAKKAERVHDAHQGKVILCTVSAAAMDDLEGRRDVKPDQRADQFIRLREVIEERTPRKFFEEQAQSDRPVVLRSIDFH
jgi:xanthine dehydrogenase iron-sulfur cluster and FAD-binding subunit A